MGNYTISNAINQHELVLRKDWRVEEMLHIDSDMKPSLSIGKPKNRWILNNDSLYLIDKNDNIYRRYKVINIVLTSIVTSIKRYNEPIKFQSEWRLLIDSTKSVTTTDLNQFVIESISKRGSLARKDEIEEHEFVVSLMRSYFDEQKIYAKYSVYINGSLSFE